VLTQDLEGGLRQRDETIFGSFAAVDVEHHAGAIDIGDLQMLGLLQAQTAGVDGGEESVVVWGSDAAQQAADFFTAKHRGQLLLALSVDEFQRMPVAVQDVLEEEADPAIADP